MFTNEDRKTPWQMKKKPLHHLYVSLIVLFIISKPVTILSDDTFCTQSWSQLYFSMHVAGGLRTNGNYLSWGYNLHGVLGWSASLSTNSSTPTLVLSPGDMWKMITFNDFYAIGLKLDGSVHGWGENPKGNIGIAPNPQLLPFQITGFPPCAFVAAIPSITSSTPTPTTYCVGINGQLWGVGDNSHGQLGVPNTTFASRTTPIQIGVDTDWDSIYTDIFDAHVCGLKKTGGPLYCWGQNNLYQVGDNTFTDHPTPFLIGSPTDKWLGVYLVGGATIALKSDGTLWAFGANSNNALAQVSTSVRLQVPTRIASPLTFKAFAATYNFAVGIASDGTIWGWGDNSNLQVKNDVGTTVVLTPNQISTQTDWAKIFVGTLSTTAFAIKTDGSLYGWGKDAQNQLGLATTVAKIGVPSPILPGRAFTTVAAYYNVAGGIDTDGEIFIWGDSQYSQLGFGAKTNTKPQTCNNAALTCSFHVCASTTCNSPCTTCSTTNMSFCLSCTSPNYLAPNNTCGTTCPIGFYGDNSTRRCMPCDSSCYTCTGPSNTSCSSCQSPTYFLPSNTSCVGSCPGTLYQNEANRSCDPCIPSCGSCSGSPSNCTSCSNASDYLSLTGSCGPTCPDGSYPDNTTHHCLACDGSCATCDGGSSSNCTSCNGTLFLDSVTHQCVNPCPNGTYGDIGTHQCLGCHSTCATCDGGSSSNCTSCNGTLYLDSVAHQCVNPCPNGTYGDIGTHQCLGCHSSCLTCNGGSNQNCTSCQSPEYLYAANHSCIHPCPNGFFGNNTSRTCDLCDVSCITCEGTSTQCTSCAPGYPVVVGTGCYAQCPGHYIRNIFICTECDQSCKGCSEAKVKCFQCATGFVKNTTSGLCQLTRRNLLRNLEMEAKEVCNGISC